MKLTEPQERALSWVNILGPGAQDKRLTSVGVRRNTLWSLEPQYIKRDYDHSERLTWRITAAGRTAIKGE